MDKTRLLSETGSASIGLHVFFGGWGGGLGLG